MLRETITMSVFDVIFMAVVGDSETHRIVVSSSSGEHCGPETLRSVRTWHQLLQEPS